ncbi:transamidase GatB domain protein [Vibrio variabilis]|uniref:Transamidase GatB domain protein n=1 Tax=Vibrio variabilis TaxID=990271 RepID=A0ABQ0JDH6_9VIBR|nr:transamidase GatB domain protein [Vibrio variabilis]
MLTKMVKQRRDSVTQFEAAGRQDLAEAEQAEIAVLEDFMPQPLTDDEVAALIDSALPNLVQRACKTWVR